VKQTSGITNFPYADDVQFTYVVVMLVTLSAVLQLKNCIKEIGHCVDVCQPSQVEHR